MYIRKIASYAVAATMGLALAAGTATAAEPWSALDGVNAVPMNAAEMDAVQGKVGSWVVAAALAQQGLGAFGTFGQTGTVFLSFYDGTPGQAGFVLFPAGNSASVTVEGFGNVTPSVPSPN